MRISGCNFSLPGPMWDMSWGANGIYADDFSSSVDVIDNVFNLGTKIRMVFFSNGGRDHRCLLDSEENRLCENFSGRTTQSFVTHSFVNNIVRPLGPNTADGLTPIARLNNNCGGNTSHLHAAIVITRPSLHEDSQSRCTARMNNV